MLLDKDDNKDKNDVKVSIEPIDNITISSSNKKFSFDSFGITDNVITTGNTSLIIETLDEVTCTYDLVLHFNEEMSGGLVFEAKLDYDTTLEPVTASDIKENEVVKLNSNPLNITAKNEDIKINFMLEFSILSTQETHDANFDYKVDNLNCE